MANKLQAVIMVAGKSTRCQPLTLTRPKPLLKVANRTILEHNLSALEGQVDEVILIVGYKSEMIKEKFGSRFGSIRLKYVEQKEQKGTAHAALQAEKLVGERFILMNGDDIFLREDIQKCLESKFSMLAAEVPNPRNYGVIEQKKGCLVRLEEKPESPKSNLINPGFYVLSRAIFPIIKKLEPSPRGEYEITDALTLFAKTRQVRVIKAKRWLPNSYSWDLLASNESLVSAIGQSDIKGIVEDNVKINGTIVVGEGTTLKSGTYIEGNVIIGKGCVIGPNCYIRGATSIGDGCKVGQAVEIKNSILMDNSKVPHLSYVGDSIIGENSNLGAGTIIANLRHEHDNVMSKVSGILVDTGRRKFGTIIGDNVHTGIHTSIYPGRKIWPGKMTRPGEIVKEDIM
jgi:UDP-N-acetylglucosamine diphosphorylase / glucose-1-phosphate thymidylyltransferase / UDP-N-acetylgalactosamine diphosphorylase / glucosamine-1-phosphate N-acetyltransferase / galactosamine-1-phosphate N-acetyltransferase